MEGNGRRAFIKKYLSMGLIALSGTKLWNLLNSEEPQPRVEEPRAEEEPLSSETLLRELTETHEVPEVIASVIVAQAIHETGNFGSSLCNNNNNLFGMKTPSLKYAKYPHWTHCVSHYVNHWYAKAERAKTPEQYIDRLQKCKYAEDPKYKQKVLSKLCQIG